MDLQGETEHLEKTAFLDPRARLELREQRETKEMLEIAVFPDLKACRAPPASRCKGLRGLPENRALPSLDPRALLGPLENKARMASTDSPEPLVLVALALLDPPDLVAL